MTKCKVCKKEFVKRSMTHKTCSPECAIEYIQAEKARKERQDTIKQRERLKSKADHAKDAQTEFNAYIRARDHGLPCISCGKNTGCKMNAGHYLSRGARPELRFNELNCHIQCEKCNSWLSGNAVMYRVNLIKKIGLEWVEWLEGPHDPIKYTIDDLKNIKLTYRAKLKELQARKCPENL